MNVRTILLWGTVLILALISGCTNANEPNQTVVTPIPTTVSGTVIRNDNLTPIANAIIFDIAGLARDTSKSDGRFSMVYQLLSQTKTTIVGSRAGFGNDTAFVTLNPGVDTTITLRLKADSSSPSGPISSGKAANIVLIASSADNISIRGTGSNETALLTFEVRDSLGIPIGGANKLKVNFSILGGPGGSEYVFPISADTDPLTGRVSTRVNSGTKAGVLQVFATATVAGTPPVTIKSSPVRITISGGLPVADHFSVSRKPINIAGGVFDNLRAQIMVIVGDREGNPVQAGTAISFTTTGGIIQPNAVTDKDGIASVDLISGNPRPLNSIAVVTATTIGDSGTVIKKSASVLFTGPTRILTPASTIIIPDSGSNSFEFRVQDPNALPIVGGSAVVLTVDGPGAGQLTLFGDINKTLEDTGDPNSTTFRVTVQDNIRKGPAGNVTFKVSVTSQNGNASATFPGYVLADTSVAPPVVTPTTSGYASNLVLVGTPTQNVSVRGTGASESSGITFVALDSVGNPVEIRRRAYVTFSVMPFGGLGGGEFLYPAADSTNSFGQVSTTFNAGTRAGVLQIVAQAQVNGRTITSSPVKMTISSGLPDLAHFTAAISPANMPGWNAAPGVKVGTVTVQVGDKFGNPVQAGTALYFTTSGGIIQATAFTNALGLASADMLGGNPLPPGGFGHVTVTTVGEGGISIQQSIPFLFSGGPQVILNNVPNDTVKVFDASSFDVDYTVTDLNGNPISGGYNIAVGVSGPGSGGVKLSGDIAVLTPDTQDKVNFTKYRFRVADAFPNADPSGELVFTITVSKGTSTYVRKFYGVLYSPQVTTIVPPSARQPSQIAFLGITNPDIYVAGVGNVENTLITYEVRDSLGVPITTAMRSYAVFAVQFFPNSTIAGGSPPTVIPNADSTDDTGKLRASIVSGTEAGVIQIVARIALANGNVIVSQPVKVSVHAGFADKAHFTFLTTRYVFPGFEAPNPSQYSPSFAVVVGDTFSNPVPTGTAVYFHTQAGIVTTGGSGDFVPTATYTNPVGEATALLLTVRPRPDAVPYYDPSYGRLGYHWVWAQTQGKGGLWIIDSVLLVWNKAPILITGIPASTITIPQAGTSNPINITVTDVNGNPLCDGTTIGVSVTFSSNVIGLQFGTSGDLPFTMPMAGYARFPGPGTTFFSFRVSDLSTGGGAPVGMTVIITVAISAPGLDSRTVSFTGQVQ